MHLKQKQARSLYIFLILTVIIEGLIISHYNKLISTYINPVIYLITGIATGVILLKMGKKQPPLKAITGKSKSPSIVLMGIMAILLGYVAFIAHEQYKQLPVIYDDIKASGSDVIPQIHYFVKRFLAGTDPYAPIPVPDLGYTLQPTYLPLRWMPYIFSEWIGIDYRYQALGVLGLSMLLFSYKLFKIPTPSWLNLLVSSIPFLFLIIYIPLYISFFKTSIEYDVAAYYLLLVISIYSKNKWAIAVSVLFCLMSRYSLVLWLPLLGLLGWYYYGRKYFVTIIAIISCGVMLSYGPFLLKDAEVFKKGYEYYASASVVEWTNQEWNIGNKYPFHLNQGLGFAHYAYEFIGGDDVSFKINVYQKVHLYMLLICLAVLTIYWWKNRDAYTFEVFSLASLKIYLTVFYSFVVIPYGYLYILPFMTGAGLLLLGTRLYYNSTQQQDNAI